MKSKAVKKTSARKPVIVNRIPFHIGSHDGGTYTSPGANADRPIPVIVPER